MRTVGALFLLFSIGYAWQAGEIPLDFWSEQEVFNARSMPYAIAALSVVIASLLILLPGKPVDRQYINRLEWKPAAILVFLLTTFGLLLDSLGFLATTCLFLVTGFLVMGERRVLKALLVAGPITLGFYLLMGQLGIHLSPGEWWLAMTGANT